MLDSLIVRTVGLCIRYFAGIIIVALLLGAAAAAYTARNFAVNTDINDLLSAKLPWRQQENAFRTAFPQVVNLILVDVEAPTPEAAEGAARALEQGLAGKPGLFRSVRDQRDNEFFRRNGLLFLAPEAVMRTTGEFANAQPVITALVRDPSLRGLTDVLAGSLDQARRQNMPLDGMARMLNMASGTLDDVAKARPAAFSWKTLVEGDPQPSDLHRVIEVWPVLDHADLEPGRKATDAIRDVAAQLGIGRTFGASIGLTGPVPIADEQFASVNDGLVLNSVITGGIIIAILWLALASVRLVAAVVVNLAVGLAVTAAIGILAVGALNPISLAFAVLFVGLGADFAIQYSIRYRAQRHESDDLGHALKEAAARVGAPLTLAAGAAAAGFFSFMPTDYSGLAQLGIIAGLGMVIAYVSSLTLLPALIRALGAPPEPRSLTFPALVPADEFLKRHRFLVVAVTVAIVAAGAVALPRLKFDFNPLDLQQQTSPATAALLKLGKDASFNTADVLVAPDAVGSTTAKLAALPEVAATRTVASFIPSDQDRKLPAIEGAQRALSPALRIPPRPAPSDDENVAALTRSAQALQDAADEHGGEGADAARRLADAMTALAHGDAAQRGRATDAFVRPLTLDLDDLGENLMAGQVTRASLPADLVRDWVAPDGRERIEATPKGDPNDNANIVKFAHAVVAAEPGATGQAVSTMHWGETIVWAFAKAAALALISIAILLWIVLRRLTDVLVTLIPLLAAAAVTLEICALARFELNYANIIALPVLLGIGVAFKIYYVTAWRRGEVNFLQSALTRAVFYSTLLTATAFGSLWLSNHAGISSMGKLLALSLACTLVSAALFQPALMGTPRHAADEAKP
jgi:hopanoid biosynthesis associated RND transporter like protein HpnN